MLRTACLATLFAAVSWVPAQETAAPAKTETLTLEKLFPEDGLFGPNANAMAFSHDGAYAAWVYRPYKERRHGDDLWVYDVAKGEVTRVTSVSAMSRYQVSTRKVRDDRVERAKKEIEKEKATQKAATAAGKAKASTEPEPADARLSGDWVTDDDHKLKEAPRYSGVGSFDWSPVAQELLFASGGDVYLLRIEGMQIERLTASRESQSQVQWLPDGKGYTFMRNNALLRVRMGTHLVEQLDPPTPPGERIAGYELSPDGSALAFVTTKGNSPMQGSRRVSIVNYRDRFSAVQEVPRTVSDDPMPEQTVSFYVYEFADPMAENGKLGRVFSHKVSGPRDIFRTPEWSPDGKRIAFAVFEQKTEQVQVLVGERAPVEPTPADKADEKDDAAKVETKENEEQGAKGEKGTKGDGDAKAKKPKVKEGEPESRPAKVVVRFLHTGGPNTPVLIRPQFLADSRRLVAITELSGFRHVHVIDPLYEQVEQLTRGRFEVYPIELSKDRSRLFVTATKDDPTRENVYAVSMADGSMEKLSVRDGSWSRVAVSPDGGVVLGTFATFGEVAELNIVRTATREQKALTDSHPDATKKLVVAKPTMFTFENRHGHAIHGHYFAPAGRAEGDKRPLLLYVYGGPLGGSRKTVEDGSYHSASYFFARYMTEKHGWVSCSIDPRGQSGYGGAFEKANYEQVGKPQVEDLVDAVKWCIANQGVDAKKVALHGWSFGGFQTQMCMYTEPDVFAVGIAGAGPTEWENYNAWYSQGTIGKTGTGTADLKKFSLLPLAKNLEGRLLLVHGMEDSNVLYQDTVRVYRELLKAGKEALVDLFLDPTGGHGLGGDVKTLNRYRKYEDFLVLHLGSAAPAATPPATPKRAVS